jgi:hypothetical protein
VNRVLGIDVGYSRTRRTTGLCALEWDDTRVDWRTEVAGTDEASRLAAFAQLGLSKAQAVEAVAIDGPLRPGLAYRAAYRAPESALSRGPFQRRGKPGPTNGGSGPRLHRAATDLAALALRHLTVRATALPICLCEAAVFEAFPNLFLGVLCDEAAYPRHPARRRRWTDTLFPKLRERLVDLLGEILPGRRIDGNLRLVDHEEVAAWVCAATALCASLGRFVAVGSAEDGFILLPPTRLWGRSLSGREPWAARALEESLAGARRDFPGVERYEP